ncbi:hypothetical protein LCGC14_3147330 [marine sediment metagenome]|uniref:Uncharacterized protein n=1 Tax=marine sediment metagenome TaxID=412755 RepID=A0A0F8Y1Y1_9ZZZZ
MKTIELDLAFLKDFLSGFSLNRFMLSGNRYKSNLIKNPYHLEMRLKIRSEIKL